MAKPRTKTTASSRPSEVRFKWVLVTPKVAREYLKKNKSNRRVRRAVVERFTRDLKEKRWVPHHQGIAFDPQGNLLDGQHRLEAIIESGVSVWMMVFWNVDKSAKFLCDIGAARTTADLFQLAGKNPHLGPIIKAVMRGLNVHYSTLSQPEILTAGDDFGKGAEFADGCFPYNMKHVTTAPVKAVLARAYYARRNYRNKIRRFAEIVLKGIALQAQNESAAITLRNYLLRKGGGKGASSVRDVYSKTERALDSFLKGEEIGRLTAASEEIFWLPGEKRQKTAEEVAEQIMGLEKS